MTPEQARQRLKLPPANPNGMADYVAARFIATPDDVSMVRARFRGKPIAVVARADLVDVIAFMAEPTTVLQAIRFVAAMQQAIQLPFVCGAPAECWPALQWHDAVKLTKRDAIRCALAQAGHIDMTAAFGRTLDLPLSGVVENSAGTRTAVLAGSAS